MARRLVSCQSDRLHVTVYDFRPPAENHRQKKSTMPNKEREGEQMCKRKSSQIDRPRMVTEGAYEGQTMRLDQRDLHSSERRDRPASGRHAGFPWWALWLIWPLIGL